MRGLVASWPADVWLRAVGGELASTAAIIGLGCRDGDVEAILAGGSALRLAGPAARRISTSSSSQSWPGPGESTTTGGS